MKFLHNPVYPTRSDYEILRDSRAFWRSAAITLAVIVAVLVWLWPV